MTGGGAVRELKNWLKIIVLIVFAVFAVVVTGARGSEPLSGMAKAVGRFDLFDAWVSHGNPRRGQIARGQEIFNNKLNSAGRSCNSCHNSANNGTNFQNLLFDVRTASAEVRAPDLPLFTFRNRSTGEIRRLTDAGRGQVTGLWADIGRFKTPTLRSLAARASTFITVSRSLSKTSFVITRLSLDSVLPMKSEQIWSHY